MTHARRLIFVLVALLVLPTTAFALDVHIKPTATAEGEFITLGELAKITPVSETAKILAEQTVLRAPAPGETTVLGVDKIRTAVLENAPGLKNVHWGGAKQVRVKRDGIKIDSKKITRIIDDFLASKSAFLPKSATVGFKPYSLPLPFVLPKGALKTEVIPADPRIIGSRSLTLIFRVDGRVVKNIAIQGELAAIAPVVIAAVDLPRGAILKADDLQMAPVDLSKMRGTPCLDLKELVGKRLVRPIRMGVPVDRGGLDIPPLVRRGDLITIQAQKGGLQVSATGISRMNGGLGQVIRARNTASHREIYCKVTGPDQAEVEF
ncbi:MAG TPA: flagellar basal body P-ring formation chaperone FlgA [Desulfuromonadales bacterium]|nr:flagellar basal body P-ring formation chaperone FlgA [Desulfuromonadales bacterium]